MILKQKKNCKLIFCNEKYYIQTAKNLYHFGKDYEAAELYYKEIREIEEKGAQVYKNGKFRLELYPNELNLVIQGLEYLKFFCDQSLFLKCDFKTLNNTSYDIEYLSQYLLSLCSEYNEMNIKNKSNNKEEMREHENSKGKSKKRNI